MKTIEDQIAALLAEAAPLRLLSGDSPDAAPLGAIVDRINALRARQAEGEAEVMPATVEGADAKPETIKRGRGRPTKGS